MALALGMNLEEAEDAAQEIRLRKLEGLGMKQTAYLAVIDHLRRTSGGKRPRKKHLSIGDKNDADTVELSVSCDQDLYQDVHHILDSFSPLHRAVCVLKSVWGMNNQEIAFVFGVTDWAIQKYVSQIKKQLLKET